MDRTFLLLFCAILFGSCVVQSQNPECQDLDSIKKNIQPAVKIVGATMNCKPNTNCTGLVCQGEFKGKKFNGTVVVQGCHKPVTFLVNIGNHELLVTNGKKIRIISHFYAFTTIRKEKNVVYVTVTIKTCLKKHGQGCILPTPILNNQRIRVHCGESRPTIPVLPWSQPADHHSQAYPPGPTITPGKKSGLAGQKRPNPECKGLKSVKSTVERNFNLFTSIPGFGPGKIDCNPTKDCSELRCSGVAKKDDFNATMFIDYCSSPITMKLRIDVPNKKIHFNHTFKNGQEYPISKNPQLSITAKLTRIRNNIHVTIGVTSLLGSWDLVKNATITVDPSHCPGYHGEPTPSHEQLEEKQCQSLIAMGKAIEHRTPTIKCSKINKCSELHCVGNLGIKKFESWTKLNYCTSPVSLHMKIKTGGKSYVHTFRDGDTYKMPLPMTVGLRRVKNSIFVNISVKEHEIVQDQVLTVDPYRCSVTGRVTDDNGKSLSGGVIAAIVIAIITVIALVVSCAVLMKKGVIRRPRMRLRPARYNDLAMSDDTNPLYDDFEPELA